MGAEAGPVGGSVELEPPVEMVSALPPQEIAQTARRNQPTKLSALPFTLSTLASPPLGDGDLGLAHVLWGRATRGPLEEEGSLASLGMTNGVSSSECHQSHGHLARLPEVCCLDWW